MVLIGEVGFYEQPLFIMHAAKLREEARECDGERPGHGELQYRACRGRHLGEIERVALVAIGPCEDEPMSLREDAEGSPEAGPRVDRAGGSEGHQNEGDDGDGQAGGDPRQCEQAILEVAADQGCETRAEAFRLCFRQATGEKQRDL